MNLVLVISPPFRIGFAGKTIKYFKLVILFILYKKIIRANVLYYFMNFLTVIQFIFELISNMEMIRIYVNIEQKYLAFIIFYNPPCFPVTREYISLTAGTSDTENRLISFILHFQKLFGLDL